MGATVKIDSEFNVDGIKSGVNGVKKQLTDLSKTAKSAGNSASGIDRAFGSLKSTMGGAVGSLVKFAGVIGLATSASTLFEGIIRGSQTTSDAFDANMRACTTTVRSFFTAISTGDFSVFDAGISNMIDKAKEANAALDQLGNTVISYDYLSSKNNAEFNKQMAIIRDQSGKYTKEQKEEAVKEAERILNKQREYTQTLVGTTLDAVKKVVAEGSVLESSNISISDIERILQLDVIAKRDSEKKKLGDEYQKFTNELNKLKKNSKYKTKEVITERYNRKTGESYQHKQLVFNTEEKDVQDLISKYKDAILYNEILVKNSDDWLKLITQLLTKAQSSEFAFSSMETKFNRGNAQVIKHSGGAGGGGSKSKYKTEKGSLADLQSQRDDLIDKQKHSAPEIAVKLQPQIDELDKQIKELEESFKKKPVVIGAAIQVIQDSKKTLAELLAEKAVLEKNLENSTADTYQANKRKVDEKDKEIEDFKNTDEHGILLNQGPDMDDFRDRINQDAEALRNMVNMQNESANGWSKIKKAAEGAEEGVKAYAMQVGMADWSSKEGREAVAKETINSIKALIMAKAIEKCMDLPFPANMIAAPLAAAAIGGLFSLIPAFASGGMIQGKTTAGDYNLARVNGGEMILNGTQQKRLFNLLDGTTTASVRMPIEREWRIEGSTLVGVIKNYNSIQTKLGRKARF